tara:strand:- start:79 stop:1281 length:1203 start_codon:yes stop_codon:yes gene_type:complete
VANLKKGDLAKVKNGQPNYKTLVDKFFHLNNKMQEFRHEEGLFMPDSMVIKIDNEEVDAFEISEGDRVDEVLYYAEKVANGGRTDNIILVGYFTENGSIRHAPITKFVKTEEFGGEGAQKENAGNKFEKEFLWSLECKINCVCKPNLYEKQVDKLLESIEKSDLPRNVSLSEVEWAGPRNAKRTMVDKGNDVAINSEGKVTKDVGSTLTDITCYFGGKTKNPRYLSCKFGNTVTFINTGIGRIFPETEFKSFNKKGNRKPPAFTHKTAKILMGMFGIDQDLFAKTFNEYGKEKMPTVTPKAGTWDKGKVENLLEYCMGYGYWMVHGLDNGTVDIYQMTKSKMSSSVGIGGITIQYGGAQGKAKRVNILCESNMYKFTFNFRGKQSDATYPTHLMCDYKKK